LLSIGRFAHFTGLTVKALRHYDSVGLLRPASVDPHTGYRRYAPDSARRGRFARRPGVQGSGRIEVRAEAGFRALAALYDGPHERPAAVSRGLWRALRREGVEPAGEPREVYLNGEGLIELVWPLAVPPSWLPSPGLFTEPLGR
jgi:hypothetical protein